MRTTFKIHPGTGGLKGQATRIIQLSAPGRKEEINRWMKTLNTLRRPFSSAFSLAFGNGTVLPFHPGFSVGFGYRNLPFHPGFALGFGSGTAFNLAFNRGFA